MLFSYLTMILSLIWIIFLGIVVGDILLEPLNVLKRISGSIHEIAGNDVVLLENQHIRTLLGEYFIIGIYYFLHFYLIFSLFLVFHTLHHS